MNYTPGPWRVIPDGGDGRFCIRDTRNHSFFVCNGGPKFWGSGGITPDVYSEYTEETLQSNANLIAAAPDLLEALVTILEQNCFEPESNIGQICETAIAKAKGIQS